MAAGFFSSVRSGFQRTQGNRSNATSHNNQPRLDGGTNLSAGGAGAIGSTMIPSFQYSGGSNMGTEINTLDQTLEPEPTKFFFREKFAKLGVKGNFMPLAAQPKHMDFGDWLAHQAHEQYRMVAQVLEAIQETDQNTGEPICNPHTCPVMSAGRAHTYTWLNKNREPIKISAPAYISMVQRWICGKLNDNKLFPTNPLNASASDYPSNGLSTPGSRTPIPMPPTASDAPLSTLAGRDWIGKQTGFPENFFTDLKTIFRQMFRLYAHTYHSHWIDPFWNIQSSNPPSSGWTDLNSLFVHFISVSKLFGLLTERDMEPMQPLIDIWVANGSIPADAAAGACAVQPSQQQQQ